MEEASRTLAEMDCEMMDLASQLAMVQESVKEFRAERLAVKEEVKSLTSRSITASSCQLVIRGEDHERVILPLGAQFQKFVYSGNLVQEGQIPQQWKCMQLLPLWAIPLLSLY